MKVCSVAEIRQMDELAMTKYRLPAEILMENAAEAVYLVIREELGIEGKKLVVLCGPGNNGGDGFAIARKIHSAGGEVKILLFLEKEKYKGAAKKNLEIIESFPVQIKEAKSISQIKNDIIWADAIIDALLGTGLDRNVDGLLRQVIELVNLSSKKVFAVDIASGINGDNGQEMGTSIKADATVTFGLPKIGNLLYPGFNRGGKLYVSHISFPVTLFSADSIKVEIAHPVPLPERRADANKMDYGPVLVIAGAANYYWAPHASAYSFLKSGGGYVYLACPKSLVPAVAKKGKEIVMLPQEETASGSIALKNSDDIIHFAERMKMVVIGPGLSLNEETQKLVRILAEKIERPLLIDGDGLTAIAGDTEIVRKRKYDTILTPHVGEMSRLMGIDKTEIEKNRIDVLQKMAQRSKAYFVLKGAHSLIGCPDGRIFINNSGDTEGKAGMATAGSGDVLNGTIAAMLCLGLNVEKAIRAGVFIHGLAGDLSAKKKGPDGITARDILNNLPYAVQYYRKNLDKISANYHDTLYSI
jgi:NAD(P)H-hydrate epimerase